MFIVKEYNSNNIMWYGLKTKRDSTISTEVACPTAEYQRDIRWSIDSMTLFIRHMEIKL